MKTSKRILALTLSVLMLAALAACGSSAEDGSSPSDEVIGDIASSAAPTETPEASHSPSPSPEQTEEPSPEPTPEQTVQPTPTPAPTTAPTPTPEQPSETPAAPSETPAAPSETPSDPSAQPSEPAEGGSEDGSVDLGAFYTTVTSNYEFSSLTDMDSTVLDNFYPGLTAVSTLQLIAKMAMITASANEIVLIQCENSDDVATVQAILEARKQAQADGGAWYPESVALWESAEICVSGNYLMLVAHQNASDIADSFYALFA